MNDQRKPKRTHAGIDLVRLLAAEGDRIFSTDRARELAPRVGLKDAYLCEALHHLRRNGWIVALRRGLYALSLSVPGVTPVHEFEVAMALVTPAAISHWSALHHHGFTDQPPRTVFVLTTSEASVPRGTDFRFIRVRPHHFFGTEQVWLGDGRVTVTDPERTLLDGLSMPQHCGDLAEVLHAFEVRGDDLNLERIVRYALRLDTVIAKRLGWVLERLGLATSKLDELADLPIKGYRSLDPTGPRQGPRNRRWMIQENLPGLITP